MLGGLRAFANTLARDRCIRFPACDVQACFAVAVLEMLALTEWFEESDLGLTG